jgi:hypothetical protein
MDIRLTNHGSLVLLHAESDAAYEWLRDHTAPEAQWWAARALVVEPRYVADILDGAREAGLEVI